MNYNGEQSIDWLFHEQLRVDEQWAIQLPSGFRWWPDQQAQTIEISRTVSGPDDELGYVVSVHTELLRGAVLDDQRLGLLNDLLMQAASMAGPVYDRQQRTLSLQSSVRLHAGISHWMNPLISVAAALQISEARALGPGLARALGAEVATSTHPSSGVRPEADEIAGLAELLFVPIGQGPSRWSETEFLEAVNQHMQGPPALLATGGGAGATVEFPFGDSSALCQMLADQRHPVYGSGLLVLESYPVSPPSVAEGVLVALELNDVEMRADGPFGYGFGSYSFKDTLRFASFYPNAMYKPGLLPNLYYASAGRARHLAQMFTGEDWNEDSFNPRRSAMGRVANSRVIRRP